MIRGDYNLRDLEEADLELVLHWRNSDRIRKSMFSDEIITFPEHIAWFNRVCKNPLGKSIYKLFEYLGSPVGLVSFTDIQKRNNKCFWGFYLGLEDLPKGTGSVMGFIGLEYAFEELSIRKVIGEVLRSNKASFQFHRKLGFSQEGILRKSVLKDNIYEDVYVLGLLKQEWLNNKSKLEKLIFTC